ncbi:mannitol dehydrogenase family protein [Marinimicrobium alkaliphilum]|uniref:mannitol dehydrogenase family protein n=1 Tax=Marinimicrobium alkaliphilum TaxID=2202654 RepID=UPI000DB926E2|nr:mannitol dehydrogenase family protein [Marinimicrobium alkaliphilum]
MTDRLSSATLARVPASIETPRYDRTSLKPGIVHLGLGAFHRGHQAEYTDTVLNQSGGDWGIIGVSLRSPAVRDQLAPQNGLYTVVVRDNDERRLRVVGSVTQVMVAPDDPAAVVAAMADPGIKIVSITVTERGYCHDTTTGNLNLGNRDIQSDLASPEAPKTIVGLIVAALRARRAAGHKSFTALSCDNLPDNGEVLKRVITQYAAQLDPALADWIGEHTAFPSTMVDRIVPATTDADRDELTQRLGLRDEGAIFTEPFSQWVIEDDFVDGRPAWENAGAQLVESAEAFEKIKLRLLNGAHSLMAYSGYLAGYEFVHDVMADPAFETMVTQFHAKDAGETVNAPGDFDIEAYKAQLRARFHNTALRHRTFQIASDGSLKLPQRLLYPLREQLERGGAIDIICLAVAAWIRFATGEDEAGQVIDINDPLADTLKTTLAPHKGDPAAMVKAALALDAVFDTDLQHQPPFVDGVTRWLTAFDKDGVRTTVQHHFG